MSLISSASAMPAADAGGKGTHHLTRSWSHPRPSGLPTTGTTTHLAMHEQCFAHDGSTVGCDALWPAQRHHGLIKRGDTVAILRRRVVRPCNSVDAPAVEAVGAAVIHRDLLLGTAALVQVPQVKRVRVQPATRDVVDERLMCRAAGIVVHVLAPADRHAVSTEWQLESARHSAHDSSARTTNKLATILVSLTHQSTAV